MQSDPIKRDLQRLHRLLSGGGRSGSSSPEKQVFLPATMTREEIRALDLPVSPDDYTEAFWLVSREEAWELFKANYIDLRTLDRIEAKLATVRYNYPRGTRVAIALLHHKDKYWTVFTRIYEASDSVFWER